jgi:hypothetical protein
MASTKQIVYCKEDILLHAAFATASVEAAFDVGKLTFPKNYPVLAIFHHDGKSPGSVEVTYVSQSDFLKKSSYEKYANTK